MSMPQVQLVQETAPANDIAEVKRPAQNYAVVEESMSEWELARMTSKTWSMEQE